MIEIKNIQSKTRSLGSVVRYSFLKTALIPILTVQLVLLCLYFFSTNYITEKNLDLLRANAIKTVSEIAKTEARHFDDQLSEIARNNRSLQMEHQALFNSTFSSLPIEAKPSLGNVSGGLSQSLNNGDSSVFVSSKTKLSSGIEDKISRTQGMDIRLTSLVDSNPNLVTAYFISHDNMVRAYPIMDDFYEQFPKDFDLTEFNFYYLADAKHNPKRESVWTNAYFDPAGKGWMLSNLVPIYKNNFLEGVTGLDVTLTTFSKHILSKNLQWNSGAIVMDKHGNILTMSKTAERYLGLADESHYNYKDNLINTKPTEFNLLKQNTSMGMYFSEFFNGNDLSFEFTVENVEYLMTKQEIPENGWQLFILAPLKNVYGPIIVEKIRITQIGVAFLGLAVAFYALFFVYLKRSSKKLAERISTPIAQINHMISTYDDSDETYEIQKPVNILELDELLSMNLKIQKAKGRYQKISEEMKIKNEQLKVLAVTDQLTQLYNRLKLDEVVCYELARSQRDITPLTIAIIDIDKFKLVNDTYGHQVGDSVLIGVSQIMLNSIRSTDILGRWGGEEFMLILPNTLLEHAFEHVDQLRQKVEKADFSQVRQVTVSIGLASCSHFACEKMLIELADSALYEAKENGRNRVEMAPMVSSKVESTPSTEKKPPNQVRLA